MRQLISGTALGIALLPLWAAGAMAAPISNPVATFSGLDKISARLTSFDVYINETVQFGSLQITPRVCYTRPAEETQRTSAFLEVDQVNLKGASKRIFTGWMFGDSPALNAIDDPVYDFWLVDCKQHSDVPPPTAVNPTPTAPAAAPATSATAAVPAAPSAVATAPASSPAPQATSRAQPPQPPPDPRRPAPSSPCCGRVWTKGNSAWLSPGPFSGGSVECT